MDAEQVRALARKLPHMVETMQWGETLVFWVGDKAIGGRMFALLSLEGDGRAVMSLSAGPERFAELIERDGLIPAPYMARIHWVALEHWGALAQPEITELLASAHARTYAKLTRKTQQILALPSAERRKVIAARRRALTEKRAQPALSS